MQKEEASLANHSISLHNCTYLKSFKGYKVVDYQEYMDAAITILNTLKDTKKNIFENIKKQFKYSKTLQDVGFKSLVTFPTLNVTSMLHYTVYIKF